MSGVVVGRAEPGGTDPAAPVPARGFVPGRDGAVSDPAWWRDAAGAGAWLVLLFVVALWARGGGMRDLGSPAAVLTSVGRVTGMVSSALLLLQVLLMARIPFVERSYGQDDLARRHRLVGFSSISLLLGHVLLVTLGYAAGTEAGIVGTFVDLVLRYPGMLLALAGTVALVLVGVTSMRWARRRWRYESWHLLHLYAYLGAGLALPHQLWTGADFVGDLPATVFWWTLWGVAVSAVLAFRVGLPLLRSARHGLHVDAVRAESATVTSVVVRGRRLDRLPARAGQFFFWRFLDAPGASRAHPYSLSAAPDGRSLRITVRQLGDGSDVVARLRPGCRVMVEGPYGRLHAGVRTRPKVLLMAGGIGIAPIRALLEDLPQQPGDVTLVHRVSSADDLVLYREVQELASRLGARVHAVAGHRRADRASWLPQAAAHLSDVAALRHLVPDVAERDVYLCGALEWMQLVRVAAHEAGVPSERIHLERFSY